MDEFEETDNYSIITDYDDGVVCFGTVTQSQIERYKKLPRHTILPSDIQLSKSFLDSSKTNENEDENDQSTSVLDKPEKNSTIPIDDSENDVTEISFLDNKEESSTIKLKQSSTNDSFVFSSPACPKFIPSENLIDTETINRYIRMGSLSPNDTFSDDQNKSTFAEDETVSNIDVQEAELSTNTYVESETSSCRPSVSSVIEQNINNHETSARDDNLCTLKHCSQQEDEDLSYCCDSEFGDNDDYSIVADKYSITPGKQRLFDLRLAKSSTRGKSVVASAPFMDKIEETTTPLPKALNSSPKLINDVSYESLKDEDNFDSTSVTILSHKSSAAHFNQTSSDWDLKSKNSIGDIVGELSKSMNFNNSVSINGIENCVDYKKSAIVGMDKEALYDSKVENNLHNKSTHENTYSNNKTIIDIDMSIKVVSESLINTSTATEQIFDTDKSINSMYNTEVSTTNINDNNEKVSEAMLADIKSTNNSVVDTTFDETLSTNILSTKSISNDFDHEIGPFKDTSNVAKLSFNENKSLDNIVVSSVNVNDTLKLSKLKDDTLKYSTNVVKPFSEKVNITFTNEIYETNENTLENLSHGKRQYLEFEQATDNIRHDTSSDNCIVSLNKSNLGVDQTMENVSVIEQTLCSDSFIPMKDDNNLSSSDNDSFRTKLSVIIENRTLEDNCSFNMVQNEHFENPINGALITSFSKDNINETTDNEKLNKSTDPNKMKCITFEDVAKSELNEMDNKSNEDKDITSDITLDEKLNKTEPCALVEEESYSNHKSVEEHFSVSKDAIEISLNQNNLNKNDVQQIFIKENIASNLDVSTIECTQESENINEISMNSKQNTSLNNDVQQLNSLCTDKIIEDSLVEFNKLEQMCKLEEVNKLQTFNYTPKTQKLLDFSIVQQTPTFENQVVKQKLLNFSIVEQMLNLEEVSSDEIDLKNSSKDSLSKNLLEISPPNVELLADESIKTNSLNTSGSSLDQTIIDTNLNLSTKSGKINDFKDNIEIKITEETNVIISSDKDVCPILLTNKPNETDEPCSSPNKTIEQINLKLSKTTESSMNETIGAKHQPACSSNTTLNQSIEKLDSTQCAMDPNKQLTFNSNFLCAIKDFSIIQQQIELTPQSKMNTNSTVSVQPTESVWNISNLIEMSMVSKIDTKSNDQTLVSSDNPVITVTSEKSINSLSNETINTAIDTEECMFSYNPEFLTDIQMNDVSLIEPPEKSLSGKSVCSIESDRLQEGNKRKVDIDQEQHDHEKKIKIEAEDLKTPMSKLYRFRNMFKSSEKRPICMSDTKENDFKSDKCHQKLNFSQVEENKIESMCYKKPDALVKSKIPCKIGDRSMSKNCEFNNTLTPSNNSIKSKKAIPRLIGTPVLSDVSNSSNIKCPASRIPFSLKK